MFSGKVVTCNVTHILNHFFSFLALLFLQLLNADDSTYSWVIMRAIVTISFSGNE